MLQRLFTLAIVMVCILWIVVSYLPGVQAMLPTIAFSGGGNWFAAFGVISILAFVGIQIWLVYSTGATLRTFQAKSNNSFHLKISAELFWTALPIAMTAGLAWASYGLWLNLITP